LERRIGASDLMFLPRSGEVRGSIAEATSFGTSKAQLAHVSETVLRHRSCGFLMRSRGRLAESCGKVVVEGSEEGSGEVDGESGLVVEDEQVRSRSVPSSEGWEWCHAGARRLCQEEDGEVGKGQISQGIAFAVVHRIALGPCISQKVAKESCIANTRVSRRSMTAPTHNRS